MKKRLSFTADRWRIILADVLVLWRERLFPPPLPDSV